ncbi:hypothetical protein GCM10029976_036840 [Kribbella albertanoniae]|uniref:Uncharacterized protein n=1 Tax=Kribbella albertanoniae TaxID=1266829 RepID=A0A4R4P202_9ACTN|nr:hypothetical protein [Kribbella albertanoniae]TDC14660.1 hypothetical protein E1261_41870 [Kribbella albertanoniae]
MNIDFGLDPTFSWYVVLLCISGAAMVGMALVKSTGQSNGARILSGVVGAAFLGYGVFLGFISEGDSYWMFFQAFFLPAILVVNFVRGALARRSERPRV